MKVFVDIFYDLFVILTVRCCDCLKEKREREVGGRLKHGSFKASMKVSDTTL